MTKIVCETATLRDAVTKAARVAPTKGHAYDKSRGVVIEIKPAVDFIRIKASDLETTYLQRMKVVSIEGAPAAWRFPSQLLAGIMTSLSPSGHVTLDGEGSEVTLSHDKTVAKLRTIEPATDVLVKAFNPNGMKETDNFGYKLDQVSWAVDDNSPILCGVHIDGERLMACDRANLPIVKCSVPVDEPITVVTESLAHLLRTPAGLKLRAEGNRLQLMPDEDTQITCGILAGKYPEVSGIRRTDFGGIFTVKTEALRSGLERLLVLGRGERYPKVKFNIEQKVLKYTMEHPELGNIKDEVAIEHTLWSGNDSEMWFDPDHIIHALDAARSTTTPTFKYGPAVAGPTQKALHITDGANFEYWGQPIRPSSSEKAKAA